jgi:hypothetical protein
MRKESEKGIKKVHNSSLLMFHFQFDVFVHIRHVIHAEKAHAFALVESGRHRKGHWHSIRCFIDILDFDGTLK